MEFDTNDARWLSHFAFQKLNDKGGIQYNSQAGTYLAQHEHNQRNHIGIII